MRAPLAATDLEAKAEATAGATLEVWIVAALTKSACEGGEAAEARGGEALGEVGAERLKVTGGV